MGPFAGEAGADRAGRCLDAVLVAAIGLTAHFALCRRFGLYLDDLVYVGHPMTWSWAQGWAELGRNVVTIPEGRPIAFVLGRLPPFLVARAGGGLTAVYLCGAVWVIANALLVRTLLSRLYGRGFGFLGALAFVLYPADTTHALLTHALAVQPAITFMLLALLRYERGRRVTAFVLAAGALLTYETAVLPFALAPLLVGPWDRGLAGRTIRHGLVVVCMVVAVLALRTVSGESRVQEVSGFWTALPGMTLRSVILGPYVGLTSFTRRSAEGLQVLVRSGTLAACAIAIAGALALRLRRQEATPSGGPGSSSPRQPAAGPRVLLAGLALTSVSYCFALPPHFPPTAFNGLMTSVHIAAGLGAAMVWGGGLALFLQALHRPPLRAAAAVIVAGFLATLWAFGVKVQQGMVRAAEQQRRNWSELVGLLPDLAPGAVVLALGRNEPDVSPFIASSSWSDALVLPLLFTAAPGDPPVSFVRVEGGAPDLAEVVIAEGGRLRFRPGLAHPVDGTAASRLESRTLMVLERVGERWIRRTGTLDVRGVSIPLLVPLPSAARGLVPGPFHDLLLGGGGSAPAGGAR